MGGAEILGFPYCLIEGKERLFPFRVIALEGTVCAGKTTLLEALTRDGYTAIREYAEYADHGRSFPSFPPKTPKEALDNFHFFLEIEKRRFNAVQQKGFAKERVVVIDRSIFTLLAFEYAASPYTGFSIFNEALGIVRASNEILIPSKIIYLEVDDETIIQRFQQKGTFCAEVFLQPKFNTKIREFFQNCCAVMPNIFVKIENSKITPDQAYTQIMRHL